MLPKSPLPYQANNVHLIDQTTRTDIRDHDEKPCQLSEELTQLWEQLRRDYGTENVDHTQSDFLKPHRWIAQWLSTTQGEIEVAGSVSKELGCVIIATGYTTFHRGDPEPLTKVRGAVDCDFIDAVRFVFFKNGSMLSLAKFADMETNKWVFPYCVEVSFIDHSDKGSDIWEVSTDVPHSKFDMRKEEGSGCNGIVISLKDMPTFNPS